MFYFILPQCCSYDQVMLSQRRVSKRSRFLTCFHPNNHDWRFLGKYPSIVLKNLNQITYKCLNAVLTCGHFLGSLLVCNSFSFLIWKSGHKRLIWTWYDNYKLVKTSVWYVGLWHEQMWLNQLAWGEILSWPLGCSPALGDCSRPPHLSICSAIQTGLVLPPFMAENDVCRIFWGPIRYWQVRAKQTHQPPARQKLTDSNTMPGWINEGKGYGNSVWLSVLGYSLFSSWFLNPASISNHNWFQNQTDVSSNHFHV